MGKVQPGGQPRLQHLRVARDVQPATRTGTIGPEPHRQCDAAVVLDPDRRQLRSHVHSLPSPAIRQFRNPQRRVSFQCRDRHMADRPHCYDMSRARCPSMCKCRKRRKWFKKILLRGYGNRFPMRQHNRVSRGKANKNSDPMGINCFQFDRARAAFGTKKGRASARPPVRSGPFRVGIIRLPAPRQRLAVRPC